MIRIKPIYDNGSNGLVNVMHKAHKDGKLLSQMSSNEIARVCCGLDRLAH